MSVNEWREPIARMREARATISCSSSTDPGRCTVRARYS